MPARPLPLALLALALAFLPAAAYGAEKIDLTDYLTVASTVGDYKLFSADNGEERRSETIEARPFGPGRFEVEQYAIDGAPVGDAAAIVLPGKRLIVIGFTVGGVRISWRPPGARRALRIAEDKPLKVRAGGKAEANGVRVGSATLRTTHTFLGFADCATPNALYVDAAHIETVSLIRVKERGGRAIELLAETSSCHAAGIGLVSETGTGRTTIDGVVEEETGPVSMHLLEGTVFGVPFDLPPPAP